MNTRCRMGDRSEYGGDDDSKGAKTRVRTWVFRLMVFVVFWTGLFCLYTYEASFPLGSVPEEDAFISFRFAENMAAGRGPVFNPTGPPVEGYTNFLWVEALALLHQEWPDTVRKALVGGFVFGFLSLVPAYLIGRRIWPRAAWTIPVFLAISDFHTGNALTGMETMAYSFFFLAAVYFFADVLQRPPGRARAAACLSTSLFLLMLALTRFEGVYFFFLFSAFWMWKRWRDAENPLRDWYWYGPFSIFYLAFTVWRIGVFGKLIPNTYFAKLQITGTGWTKVLAGLDDVGGFLMDYPAVVLVTGLYFLTLRHWKSARIYPMFLGLVVVIHFVVVVIVGGDWPYLERYWRLLTTVAPLFFVHGLVVLRILVEKRKRVAALFLLAGVLLLTSFDISALSLFGGQDGRRQHQILRGSLEKEITQLLDFPSCFGDRVGMLLDYEDEHEEKTIGLWLRHRLGPDGVLAGDHAGRIPYYSRLKFIDAFGYTDRRSLQARSNDAEGRAGDATLELWEYLFESSPDMILLTNKSKNRTGMHLFFEVMDRHGFSLSHSFGRHIKGQRRAMFVLFSPIGTTSRSTGGAIEIAGRSFPHGPEDWIESGGGGSDQCSEIR